jgi:hypothetical protein
MKPSTAVAKVDTRSPCRKYLRPVMASYSLSRASVALRRRRAASEIHLLRQSAKAALATALARSSASVRSKRLANVYSRQHTVIPGGNASSHMAVSRLAVSRHPMACYHDSGGLVAPTCRFPKSRAARLSGSQRHHACIQALDRQNPERRVVEPLDNMRLVDPHGGAQLYRIIDFAF